jgi:hydrogenase maturation factor HypE
MKEIAIREYISNIDFVREDWSLSKIKEEMRKFLGEEPGIDILYKKDVIINEIKGEAQEISKIDKISIVFTDLDDKFRKIEFLID